MSRSRPTSGFLGLAVLLLSTLGASGSARAITSFHAVDAPNDRGAAIDLHWGLDDGNGADSLRIERSTNPSGPFTAIAVVPAARLTYRDSRELMRSQTYSYRVDGRSDLGVTSAIPTAQWFNLERSNVLLILGTFLLLILYFIDAARRGQQLFIRKIPALDAIEEAVGRATEMGKSVLYVPGIDDANNIQTIYSMVILNSVAKMVARYDTSLIVPVSKPFVVPLAEETVRAGYLDVGRPEAFDKDNIRYLSDEQFAFTAAVNGIMLRERPAANLFLGSFFAESLMLAETGLSTGAVQIAGTANVHQLPFFVVACDYTMIGEEFYASSAYLSREPMVVGALKGTDAMKLILILCLLVGVVFATAGDTSFVSWFEVR